MDVKKGLFAVLLAGTCASAQSEFDSLGYVAAVFGAAALALSYRLIYAKDGLDAQILKKTAQLRKLNEEVAKYEREVKIRKEEASKNIDARTSSELERAKAVADGKARFEGLEKHYWERMNEMDRPSATKADLRKLIEEKAEVERMIALTKTKYLEMDKKTFDNIMEGYQRMQIELEAKISRIRGENGVT